MLLKFTKMHGLGNDFMVIDGVTQNVRLTPEQIKELGDRHFGVGFDQLLLVEPPGDPDMDFRYRIFNADGSEVEQCGNGARCFAQFVRDRKLTASRRIRVQTSKGNIELRVGMDDEVTVDMGRPELEPYEIPFKADRQSITYKLEIEGREHEISAISMGNPHAVLLVDDCKNAPVELLGRKIQRHARFPENCNVGFMEIVNPGEVNLRVYERGVGETLACGTGACAAVVAGRLQGLLEPTVKVTLPGGSLTITWREEDQSVLMTGPATRVYEGHIRI
ncbi:diaminopimelate epimerase [Parendozoicomonas haliclonae]|uniref:Diaminopimelate epimerase n=1 Tax=Parendozoicomonas haliclonae TaxID=1960125 RepID=A0A1X7ALS2_9GAMM|nr:diaminopimelate epimerase [Parendozoicomonas haliclonae]SMA48463.1 Diaminopimelate epimerase [Parendozoicomonas haliclonae]